MKFISNFLYITFEEAVDCGISLDTIKSAKSRNSSSWEFIDDPSDRRKVLIKYEALQPKYKALVVERFGDPYKYEAANILKPYITTDHNAVQYLLKFRLNDGKALSEQHIKKYTDACNLLNFIAKTDKKAAKQIGFPDKNTFTEAIINYIKSESIELPQSYRRLTEAVRNYEREGAASVISGKIGNQNRSKVKDELALALLKKLIEHPNGLGDHFIALKYNEWAVKNGMETLSKSTVGNYKREYEMELLAGRKGTEVYRDKFDPVVHRKRASAPLLLINSDDNVLDLYFIKDTENKKGHHHTDYYHRYVLYVVTDTFNDYPLGYAIGNTVTKELIKEAYRNACNHIYSLTGAYYLPHQLVTDRWGINPSLDSELAQYFKAQGTFTPAKFSNSRSKHIEQSFSNKWHGILKTYTNYAGHNVSAKDKLNREAVEINKRDYPTIEQAPAQIAEFIERVRRTVPAPNQLSKQQEWIQAWNEMDVTKRIPLDDERRLMLYGKQHSHSTKLTNKGVQFTIQWQQFTFDVPEYEYTKFVGTTGTVLYDPSNLNQVLFTADEGRIRILCTANQAVPSALADFTEGDGKLLSEKLAEKKRINQGMIDKREERDELLQRAQIDVASILQAGVLSKQISHEAQISYTSGSVKQLRENNSEESDFLDRL